MTTISAEHGVVIFAQQLIDLYEQKGHNSELLFLALVSLLAQDDPRKVSKALSMLDDIVMEAEILL